MDMLNILKNFDAAGRGEKPSAGAANVNDMKAILESFQAVQECGMDMPAHAAPEPDKVNMNVTLNARGTDAIEELIALMGGAKAPQEAPVRMPSQDMARMIALASDEHEGGEEEHEPEMDEWANSPEGSQGDESYDDHTKMIHDLSGGINKEKKMYAKAQDGDNPMAVAEDELAASLRESLSAQLRAKFDELSK